MGKHLGLAAVAAAWLALGAITPRSSDALLYTPSGSTVRILCNVGGVQIYVGYQNGPSQQTGSSATSQYGHWGNGNTCQGSCSRTVANVLDVGVQWGVNDATDIGVYGVVDLQKNYAQQMTYDWDCPQGPPTWNATGQVKAAAAVVGISGSGDTSLPGTLSDGDAWAHTTNPTGWTHGTGTAKQSTTGPYGWHIDANDPGTQSINVTTTVDSVFSGTGIEIRVIICTLMVTVTLSVNVVA